MTPAVEIAETVAASMLAESLPTGEGIDGDVTDVKVDDLWSEEEDW